MEGLVPIIVLIVVFSLLSDKNRKRRQPQRPQHHAEPEKVENQVKDQVIPNEIRQQTGSMFCGGSGTDEQSGWDNEVDFHEGEEDASHDHGGVTEPLFLEEEKTEASDEAKEMLRGVIWSEILNRKRR